MLHLVDISLTEFYEQALIVDSKHRKNIVTERLSKEIIMCGSFLFSLKFLIDIMDIM